MGREGGPAPRDLRGHGGAPGLPHIPREWRGHSTPGHRSRKEALAMRRKVGQQEEDSISAQDNLTGFCTGEAGWSEGTPGPNGPGFSSETQLSGPGVFARTYCQNTDQVI